MPKTLAYSDKKWILSYFTTTVLHFWLICCKKIPNRCMSRRKPVQTTFSMGIFLLKRNRKKEQFFDKKASFNRFLMLTSFTLIFTPNFALKIFLHVLDEICNKWRVLSTEHTIPLKCPFYCWRCVFFYVTESRELFREFKHLRETADHARYLSKLQQVLYLLLTLWTTIWLYIPLKIRVYKYSYLTGSFKRESH